MLENNESELDFDTVLRKRTQEFLELDLGFKIGLLPCSNWLCQTAYTVNYPNEFCIAFEADR